MTVDLDEPARDDAAPRARRRFPRAAVAIVCVAVLGAGIVVAASYLGGKDGRTATDANTQAARAMFAKVPGSIFLQGVAKTARERGVATRDPALLKSVAAGLQHIHVTLADGTPVATATRADWERVAWKARVDGTLDNTVACVEIPQSGVNTLTWIQSGPCVQSKTAVRRP